MSKPKPNTDHIIFDAAGNAVYCQHCGAKISFTLPIELGLFVVLLKGFNKAHQHCMVQPNLFECDSGHCFL